MSRTSIILAALGVITFLPSCGEKTEAEKAEEERATLREEKRKKAVEIYKTLAREHPDDPRAEEAKKKAAALEAAAPKK